MAATANEKTGNQVSFWKEIYPIFIRSCLKCHGPGKQLGGFRVDQPDEVVELLKGWINAGADWPSNSISTGEAEP